MKIHFIGIGGIGMSGLASIQFAKGNIVSGSDLRPNNLTDELSKCGADIRMGHLPDNVQKDVDIVVRSSCIKDDNPEVRKALENNIPVISRGEMLKNIIAENAFSISVTGTHGKTTTSALIAHILDHCKRDPTFIVGGEINNFESNAGLGNGDVIVAEVDESDGYFRNIKSTCVLITNIEEEHMENYGSINNLVDAYEEFINNISSKGFLVFNGNDCMLKDIIRRGTYKSISFGLNGDFDITCKSYSCGVLIEFDAIIHGKDYGKVSSSLIGQYNLMNILGAIGVSVEIGLDFKKISEAINSFSGVKRRFDLIGRIKNIEIREDYAHHPTELNSILKAAKDYSKGRVIAVFQPHRYSRTRDMMYEFANCFYDADILFLTDIYSADEDEINDISVKNIYEIIDKNKFERLEIVEKDKVSEKISEFVGADDIVLVLGAGDIREISGEIVKEIGATRV